MPESGSPLPRQNDAAMHGALRRLVFRPERSRPVWRNKHTGTEVTVLDLAVNDHGGFQGGCRQFVVVTDEPGPPGPPSPPPPRDRGPDGAGVKSLDSFLEHWEPTGQYVDFDQTPEKVKADELLEARREANGLRRELQEIRDSLNRAMGGAA